MPEARTKLPVPGPWQPAVEAARRDLARRLGLPEDAVAPTRVESADELPDTADARPGEALAVWLLAGGETFRYRVTLADHEPSIALVSGATWMSAEG